MINMKKVLMCWFILELSCIYSSDDNNINENVEDEDLEEIDDNNEKSNNNENKSNNKKKLKHTNNKSDDETKSHDNETELHDSNEKETNIDEGTKNKETSGGWHSGLDLKVCPTTLISTETKPDNSNVPCEYKNCLISPSMFLGYNFILNKFLILGVEVDATLNFGSSIKYKDKIHNQDISRIKKGVDFAGIIKLGLALGSWSVYGKLGGDLSKWKYDWKGNDNNKDNKENKYDFGLVYGCGIEKQFSNNIYLRTEVLYSPNTKHDDTALKVKDCKLSDIKSSNYQISIGGGYKF